MDWLYYLLEANLYLIIFYGFYRLLLQNQTFYNSNRYYLLASSLTAFALPILQIGYLKPAPKEFVQLVYTNLPPTQPTWNLSDYLYMAYILIAFAFAIKLLVAIGKIMGLWLGAKKHKNGNFTLIELQHANEAFSFFNLLFIHPQMAEKQVVLKHELVHIKQKHSLDVLFFELLQIVCWFNPIIYFIKKDVKLLHEYIADELSATTNQQKHEYVMFLIENSFGVVPHQLTNQFFNQSILKRRINMLNKKRTTNWARFKLLLALPLGGVMLCTSTMAFTKDYGYVDLFPEKNKVIEALVQQDPKVENIKKQTVKVENIKKQEVKPDNVKKTKKNQVKFPPPAGKAYETRPDAPAIEPPPPTVKTVRFPPPIVKSDKAAPAIEPPPPHKQKMKKDQVKFPPPIVKEDKKGNNDEADLNAKIAALPSVSIASTNPENAKKRYATKENQIAITNVEQAQAVKSDPKPIYSITLKEPQERLKSIQVKEPDQSPGTKGVQQNLRITVKPSMKDTKKGAKQPITLELLPSKNQP